MEPKHPFQADVKKRLSTFKDWPFQKPEPQELAEHGFFHSGTGDIVVCFACGERRCGALLAICQQENPWKSHSKCVSEYASCIAPPKISSPAPKHPFMADVKKRLSTFQYWPHKVNTPTPQELAECGLYYTNLNDFVTCFFCNGVLGDWNEGDDSWADHIQYFPDCAFIKKNKRPSSIQEAMSPSSSSFIQGPSSSIQDAIIDQALKIFPDSLVYRAVQQQRKTYHSLEDICDEILNLHWTKEETNSSSSTDDDSSSIDNVVKTEQEETNSFSSIDNVLSCTICMQEERNVLFQPCNHLVSCDRCSKLIFDCPICRKQIVCKTKVFM